MPPRLFVSLSNSVDLTTNNIYYSDCRNIFRLKNDFEKKLGVLIKFRKHF